MSTETAAHAAGTGSGADAPALPRGIRVGTVVSFVWRPWPVAVTVGLAEIGCVWLGRTRSRAASSAASAAEGRGRAAAGTGWISGSTRRGAGAAMRGSATGWTVFPPVIGSRSSP